MVLVFVFLFLGGLMYEFFNFILRNSDLENLCIYLINEEFDVCGVRGWYWEIYIRMDDFVWCLFSWELGFLRRRF